MKFFPYSLLVLILWAGSISSSHAENWRVKAVPIMYATAMATGSYSINDINSAYAYAGVAGSLLLSPNTRRYIAGRVRGVTSVVSGVCTSAYITVAGLFGYGSNSNCEPEPHLTFDFSKVGADTPVAPPPQRQVPSSWAHRISQYYDLYEHRFPREGHAPQVGDSCLLHAMLNCAEKAGCCDSELRNRLTIAYEPHGRVYNNQLINDPAWGLQQHFSFENQLVFSKEALATLKLALTKGPAVAALTHNSLPDLHAIAFYGYDPVEKHFFLEDSNEFEHPSGVTILGIIKEDVLDYALRNSITGSNAIIKFTTPSENQSP